MNPKIAWHKIFLRARKKAALIRAMYWQHFYDTRNKLRLFCSNHKIICASLITVSLFILNLYTYPIIKTHVNIYFSINDRIDSLKSLFLGLGGALIGATAIAFSLIMFAMQVNVGRLPYGLFKKFSTDSKLLSLFVFIMILAISICSMSLIQDSEWATMFSVFTFWGVFLIILLTLTAYRRALSLISPFEQLSILVSNTKNNLVLWSKAANRAIPLLKKNTPDNETEAAITSNHEIEKTFYLNNLHPYWIGKALRAIEYCTAISRYHSVQGDYEISQAAINSIVIINQYYISVKGKTFYVDNPFFPTPLSNDELISKTLENFRKNAHIAITRGDEQQIIQYLHGFEKLCCNYLTIDYSNDNPTKSHANLAAGYLASVVESTIPSKLIEVTMEGLRKLGSVARYISYYGNKNDICTISEKISVFAAAHVTDQNLWPAAQTGTNELTLLTLSLINNAQSLSNYAINELNDDIRFIAEFVINKSGLTGLKICSQILAPYYSVTDPNSLQSKLAELCNAVLKAKNDNKNATKIIEHVAKWGKNLSEIQKKLFILALNTESHFIFDIINWIVNITEIFLALSNAEACGEYYKAELQNNATKLICTLSCHSHDENAIRLLENYKFIDLLFGAAVTAKNRECIDIALKIRKMMLLWLSKSTQSSIRRTIFEEVCYGLTCLDMILEKDNDILIKDIQIILDQEISISDEDRVIIAHKIESRLNHHYSHDYSSSKIELALIHADKEKLQITLNKLVKVIRLPESS
ncbi:Uncharacterised protein [Legionella sainthelensi]|uniref:hypothetical protein n=1 Tax=Legionella sainthelensi TaxID=28087 RepID=UPI000F6CC1A9|nr:hypothetical protein [Legionella sainthelensi]VEB35474.1 Uncharacterised protein [Legionella sainthelensi]